MAINQVYAILADCEPPKVKFGISKNPQARLGDIQVCCPHKVKLLASVKASRSLEKRIHNGLRHLRVIGGWFRYEHEACDLVALMQYSDADGIYKHLDCLAHEMYCASLEITPDLHTHSIVDC